MSETEMKKFLPHFINPSPESASLLNTRHPETFTDLVIDNFPKAVMLGETIVPQFGEEIANDAFLRLWNHIDHIDFTGAAGRGWSTWLYSTVVNLGIDQIRRNKRPIEKQTVYIDDSEEYEQGDQNTFQDFRRRSLIRSSELPSINHSEAEGVENQLLFDQTISLLPAKQKTVISMYFLDGFTMPEIAEQLKDNLGTIKSRLRLGLDRLRILFQDEDFMLNAA